MTKITEFENAEWPLAFLPRSVEEAQYILDWVFDRGGKFYTTKMTADEIVRSGQHINIYRDGDILLTRALSDGQELQPVRMLGYSTKEEKIDSILREIRALREEVTGLRREVAQLAVRKNPPRLNLPGKREGM